MRTFAAQLRSLREGKGWSQRQLSDASGASQKAISQWENGERVPAFDAVQALCKALGVSCSEFDDCTYDAPKKTRGRGRPKKS